jgi:hypothetical protein
MDVVTPAGERGLVIRPAGGSAQLVIGVSSTLPRPPLRPACLPSGCGATGLMRSAPIKRQRLCGTTVFECPA